MATDSADSARERLERLQSYCDQALRTHTWQLKRMPSIPTQRASIPEVQQSRAAVAVVLAYVEGAQDSRAAGLAAHEEIIPRYERLVEEERWEPDFGPRADLYRVDPSLARPDREISVHDAQDEALDVFAVAERHLGEERFGGGWIDVSLHRPAIRIAVVEPTDGDVDLLMQAGRAGHWDIYVRAVTYSRTTLIGLYAGLDLSQVSSVTSVGWSPELNRVVVTLTGWDEDTVRYFRKHVPADALQIDIVPGLRSVAADS